MKKLFILLISALAMCSLVVAQTTATALVKDVTVSIGTLLKGQNKVYTFTIPAGSTDLVIKSTGPNGDADIYLSKDTIRSRSSISKALKSIGYSSNETIRVAAPAPGTYYLQVYAYKNTTNLSLSMAYTGGTAESTHVPVCSYAAPPAGCIYMQGTSYNPTTSCGMVLTCANVTSASSSAANSVDIEAELGRLVNGPRVMDYSQASGGKSVGYLSNTGSAYEVGFNSSLAASADLSIRYSNGYIVPSTVRVTLNGSPVISGTNGVLSFAPTGSWGIFQTQILGNASLISGLNILRIEKTSTTIGAIDFDYLRVVKQTNAIITNSILPSGSNVNSPTTPAPDFGSCGSSAGQALSTAPTSNLCGRGTPSFISGSGPWSWTCNGSNGGSSAACSASKMVANSTSPNLTAIPTASQIVDSYGAVWTVRDGIIYRNGNLAGYSDSVTKLLLKDGRIYQQNSYGGWWYWNGSNWTVSNNPETNFISNAAVPTLTLTAQATDIAYNTNTSITWSSVDASSCTTPFGSTAGAGTYTTPNLTTTTNYTITCMGAGGSVTKNLNISVRPMPALSSSEQVFVSVNGSDTANGSQSLPFKTFARAIQALKPGSTLIIMPGTYRESLNLTNFGDNSKPTVIKSFTPGTVFIKGSDQITDYTSESNGLYSINSNTEPAYVFVNGESLQKIAGTVFGGYPVRPSGALSSGDLEVGNIWPGRVSGDLNTLRNSYTKGFYYDENAKRVYFKPGRILTASDAVEVSVRKYVATLSGKNIILDGLNMLHSNTVITNRDAAIHITGENITVKNSDISYMSSQCIVIFGSKHVISNNNITYCGQVGIAGRGTFHRVENNKIMYNNTFKFNENWEAGGIKFVGPTGDNVHNAIVKGNTVAFNNGAGIWFDWLNTNNVIEDNTVAYNTNHGIFYEVSTFGTIRNNFVYGNAWRGIYGSGSSNMVIENNKVIANAFEGIGFVTDNRISYDSRLNSSNNRFTGNKIFWNDHNRNYIQLIIPGTSSFNTTVNNNSYNAFPVKPRMSIGFMTSTNWYSDLQLFKNATGYESTGTSANTDMSSNLKTLLNSKILLNGQEF